MWWLMTHFILIIPVGNPKCSAVEHHDHHLLDCLHHAPLNSRCRKELMSLARMCHGFSDLQNSVLHPLWKQSAKGNLSKPHEQKYSSQFKNRIACSQSQEILLVFSSFFLSFFFLIKLFIFYWSIADKLWCDSFRQTARGLSHTYMPVVLRRSRCSRSKNWAWTFASGLGDFNRLMYMVLLRSGSLTIVYWWWGSGHAAPNMPLWHIDYFELKLLKKQLVQEKHSEPPLSPWKQEINLQCERYPPCPKK